MVPRKTVRSAMALVAPKHEGRIDFREFLEFWLLRLPMCRGYCKDCRQVIMAGERPGGFVCNKCRAPGGGGFLTSARAFTLCWECYKKVGAESTRWAVVVVFLQDVLGIRVV